MERWEDIKDFEGLYQVSNLGRVWSVRRKIIVAQATHLNGYKHLTLHKDGKRYNKDVHRLVAEAFCYNPDPTIKTQVNHKDEDKTNNNAENLEWVTPKENSNYGTRTERSIAPRRKKIYLRENNTTYDSIHHAARELGMNISTIYNSLNAKTEKHRKYHFSLVA